MVTYVGTPYPSNNKTPSLVVNLVALTLIFQPQSAKIRAVKRHVINPVYPLHWQSYGHLIDNTPPRKTKVYSFDHGV